MFYQTGVKFSTQELLAEEPTRWTDGGSGVTFVTQVSLMGAI